MTSTHTPRSWLTSGKGCKTCTHADWMAEDCVALVQQTRDPRWGGSQCPSFARPEVRVGWEMPEPPEAGLLPFACNEGGDGWLLFWESASNVESGDYEESSEIEWPFRPRDHAGREDLAALGFLDPHAFDTPIKPAVRAGETG